mmetsp:Transcript_66136/g.173397  ORF Transcript_66136/g.173397 Transcript_66136/m.173397 type:complete len:375 (+) Transcript_66136:230-1354(+)
MCPIQSLAACGSNEGVLEPTAADQRRARGDELRRCPSSRDDGDLEQAGLLGESRSLGRPLQDRPQACDALLELGKEVVRSPLHLSEGTAEDHLCHLLHLGVGVGVDLRLAALDDAVDVVAYARGGKQRRCGGRLRERKQNLDQGGHDDRHEVRGQLEGGLCVYLPRLPVPDARRALRRGRLNDRGDQEHLANGHAKVDKQKQAQRQLHREEIKLRAVGRQLARKGRCLVLLQLGREKRFDVFHDTVDHAGDHLQGLLQFLGAGHVEVRLDGPEAGLVRLEVRQVGALLLDQPVQHRLHPSKDLRHLPPHRPVRLENLLHDVALLALDSVENVAAATLPRQSEGCEVDEDGLRGGDHGPGSPAERNEGDANCDQQ